MIILCDVDGVVADLQTEWLKRYNSLMSTKFTPEDVEDWDFSGLDLDHRVLLGILWDKDLYEKVGVIEGALGGVRELRNMGHRVVFATSSTDVSAGQKMRWLRTHGFVSGERMGAFRDIVIAHDKSLLKGDVMVDDYHMNLLTFHGMRLLFDAPHNRYIKGFKRVNWLAIPRLLPRLT